LTVLEVKYLQGCSKEGNA